MPRETELHVLQLQLREAVGRTRQAVSSRSRQEEELISAASQERALAHLFSRQPPPLPQVVQLLREAGEEDLVESECARRYAAYVEKKAALFFSATADLDNAAAQLSTTFKGRSVVQEPAARKSAADCGAVDGAAQVHEFEALLRASAALHEKVLSWVGSFSASSRCSSRQVQSESNSDLLESRKEAISKALAEMRDELSDAKARRAELVCASEGILARLKENTLFVMESKFGDSGAVNNGSSPVLDSAHPLHEWQISAEEQQHTRSAADAEAAQFDEKTDLLQVQTQACKSAAEWASREAAAGAEKASQLNHDCSNVHSEAHVWALKCEDEREHLAADVERWKCLCRVLESQAEENRVKAVHLAAAQQKQHTLLVQKETLQAAASRINSVLQVAEEELRRVKAVNQHERDELRYLSSLASASLSEPPVRDTNVVSEMPVSGVSEYLRFIHRARAARANCQ